MPDVNIKKIDELEGYKGLFLHAGKALGVKSWGMNILKLPPKWPDYPDHDHKKDGQEEVYVVLRGSVTLQAEGTSWDLTPGMLARVGPEQKRKITPGDDGVTILVLGGIPGKAYEPTS